MPGRVSAHTHTHMLASRGWAIDDERWMLGKPLLSYGLSRNVIIAHGRPAQCVQTRRETIARTSKWYSCGQEDKYTTNLITVSWLAVCTALGAGWGCWFGTWDRAMNTPVMCGLTFWARPAHTPGTPWQMGCTLSSTVLSVEGAVA